MTPEITMTASEMARFMGWTDALAELMAPTKVIELFNAIEGWDVSFERHLDGMWHATVSGCAPEGM